MKMFSYNVGISAYVDVKSLQRACKKQPLGTKSKKRNIYSI